jgi:hypothetical protein
MAFARRTEAMAYPDPFCDRVRAHVLLQTRVRMRENLAQGSRRLTRRPFRLLEALPELEWISNDDRASLKSEASQPGARTSGPSFLKCESNSQPLAWPEYKRSTTHCWTASIVTLVLTCFLKPDKRPLTNQFSLCSPKPWMTFGSK